MDIFGGHLLSLPQKIFHLPWELRILVVSTLGFPPLSPCVGNRSAEIPWFMRGKRGRPQNKYFGHMHPHLVLSLCTTFPLWWWWQESESSCHQSADGLRVDVLTNFINLVRLLTWNRSHSLQTAPNPHNFARKKEHLFTLTIRCPHALEPCPVSFYDLHKALQDETPAHISHLNSCHAPPHSLCFSHISMVDKRNVCDFSRTSHCFSLGILGDNTCLQ